MARKGTTTFNGKTGVWRTVGGRRIFIATGQSLEDAMKASGKFDDLKPSKSTAKSKSSKADEYKGYTYEELGKKVSTIQRELRRDDLDEETKRELRKEMNAMQVAMTKADFGYGKESKRSKDEEAKNTKKSLEENERVAKDAYDKAVDKWQYARDRYEAGSEPYEKAKREYENATRAYTDAGRATSEYYADEYRKSVENTKGPGKIQKEYGLKDVRNEEYIDEYMNGYIDRKEFGQKMIDGGESVATTTQAAAKIDMQRAQAQGAKEQKAWDDKVRNVQIDQAISSYQKYGKQLNTLREEQSKYDWQSDEYKAINAQINEVAKKRSALKKEALTKFNESIPDDEMYKVAEEISGIKGLSFTKKMHTNYENREYPVYESNDISDKAGVFGNVIKSAKIETFNSSLSLNEETGEPSYWGTMSLRYESKSGGSNGMELMDIRYDRKNGWQIKDASGYIYQNGKKLSTVSQMKQYFIDRGYSASSAQDMATEYINNRIVR